MSRMVVKPDLLDLPWHCVSTPAVLVQQFQLLIQGSGPPTFLTRAWFGSLWFVLVSKNEISATSLLFWGCLWNSGRVADCLTCDSINLVPVVFQSVAETFNPFHELAEGLYSSGWQQHNWVYILSNYYMDFWIHSHKHLVHLHFATVNHHWTVYCHVFSEHLTLLSSETLLRIMRCVRLLPHRMCELHSAGLYRSKESQFPLFAAL
jgi:hypothetical protein